MFVQKLDAVTDLREQAAVLALDHGKRLFLVRSLVMHESWATRYAESPATTVVESVEDVLDVLDATAQPVEQLTLG